MGQELTVAGELVMFTGVLTLAALAVQKAVGKAALGANKHP